MPPLFCLVGVFPSVGPIKAFETIIELFRFAIGQEQKAQSQGKEFQKSVWIHLLKLRDFELKEFAYWSA